MRGKRAGGAVAESSATSMPLASSKARGKWLARGELARPSGFQPRAISARRSSLVWRDKSPIFPRTAQPSPKGRVFGGEGVTRPTSVDASSSDAPPPEPERRCVWWRATGAAWSLFEATAFIPRTRRPSITRRSSPHVPGLPTLAPPNPRLFRLFGIVQSWLRRRCP